MYRFAGINSALVGLSEELLKNGEQRITRGQTCYEIPHPVTVAIENPRARYVMIPERKWNRILPFAESLWLALGMNDLDKGPGQYVKNLYNFSDDGRTWRAGYGPRMRAYNNRLEQYDYSQPAVGKGVDQFQFVADSFKRDPETRQAVIEIADPMKDCFVGGRLIQTKDMPCTRSLHLMKNTRGELDLVVKMRSNDLLWGFSAVNVFNFTWIQEYFSYILGLPVGTYYHQADNLHVYAKFWSRIEAIAQQDRAYWTDRDCAMDYDYRERLTLGEFDFHAERIYMSTPHTPGNPEHPFFQDWAGTFCRQAGGEYQFHNPAIEKLFGGE